MRSDWWHFWDAEAWRAWRQGRAARTQTPRPTARAVDRGPAWETDAAPAPRPSLPPPAPARSPSPGWAAGAVALLTTALVVGVTQLHDREAPAVADPTSDTVTTTVSSVPARSTTTVSSTAGVVALPLAPTTITTSGPAGTEVTVVRVIDGDTIEVRFDDGTSDIVRLIGINAPEVDSGECLAEESTAMLRRLVAEKRVVLVSDMSDRDQYERLLRYIWVGGQSVGEAMVGGGFAFARRYPPDVAEATALEVAESGARLAGRGLWASDACAGSAEASIEIVDLVADAPGDDSANLNGEYVVIRNAGSDPVNLGGWTIQDNSSNHRYSFPPGSMLGSSETVTLHTGCGTDGGGDLFWCEEGSAVWNNDGDTAYLRDPNGNIHHYLTYQPTG